MGLRILSKTHLKRLYTEFERSLINMSINGMSLQNIHRFYLSFIKNKKIHYICLIVLIRFWKVKFV